MIDDQSRLDSLLGRLKRPQAPPGPANNEAPGAATAEASGNTEHQAREILVDHAVESCEPASIDEFEVVTVSQRAINKARGVPGGHLTDALIKALEPLVSRVRTDVSAIKKDGAMAWTREPITPGRLAKHLNGGPARGVCPIKAGESTTLVALLDLDSHKGETSWELMAEAARSITSVLQQRHLAVIPYRSSGGHGVHLYVLWDDPQDAYSVRMLLVEALAECGFANGTAGVRARQVEVFPKQNSVKADGFGNQFILPLAGMSVPLDPLDYTPLEKDPELVVWPLSRAVEVRQRPDRPTSGGAPADPAMAERALWAIPNTIDDRSEWFNVMCAAKEAGVDKEVARNWTMQHGSYDEGKFDGPWDSITVGKEEGVGAEYLFVLAQRHGFHEHIVQDFEVVQQEQRFPVLSPGEFANRPPLRWIIKGLLPMAELVVMFGPPGSGKSFMAFDLAAAIARGISWRGRKTRKGRVIYIAAEAAIGFQKRYLAYAQHAGIPLDAVAVEVIAGSPNFLVEADAQAVLRSVDKADLIVVDTFAQVTPGGNENSGEDMGKALAHCKSIHRATGATVLLVHHTGKDVSKGARGWSGLRAAADAELEVVREGDVRAMSVSKQKDEQDGGVFGFALEVVSLGIDEDGDPVRSCVVVETAPPVARVTRKMGRNQALVHAVIQEMAEAQTSGIEVEAVVEEAVRRTDPPARKDHMRRALRELCLGDDAIYNVKDGCVAVP